MQGVVLAAGEGTRMGPLTDDRPKGLVEVAGKPLLTHVFEALLDAGVAELVVVVGYRAGDVVAHCGERFEGTPITYVHQRERRGLAHALARAGPVLDGDFCLVNGDNVVRADLAGLAAHHRETDADATLLVERVDRDTARETGVLSFEGEDPVAGTVTGLVEKPSEPPSRWVPRGCYVFSPAILDACRLVTPSERGECELTDAVNLLVAAGRRVEAVPLEGWVANVNEPADRERVARRLSR